MFPLQSAAVRAATPPPVTSGGATGVIQASALAPDFVAASNRPAEQRAGTERSAAADPPPFTPDGRLSHEALEWADALALNPARAARGAGLYVAATLFAWLNTGNTALALPYLKAIIGLGARDLEGKFGLQDALSVGDLVAQLRADGLDVHAEVFVNRHSFLGEGSFYASLAKRVPKCVDVHPIEDTGRAEGLRARIATMQAGEAAILFVAGSTVCTIARDADGWHVFDYGLNPQRNVFEGAQLEFELRRYAPRAAWEARMTPDGRNHVHGDAATAMIDRRLDNHHGQAVLLRMVRPSAR